jgi:hypothetical protein
MPDDPGLGAIAHELGDLPLALHLAASYSKGVAQTRTERAQPHNLQLVRLQTLRIPTACHRRMADPPATGRPRLQARGHADASDDG